MLGLSLVVLLLPPVGWWAWSYLRFPSDRTPEGAYLRIIKAVHEGRAEAFFAYTETEAQHACFTIRTYRRQARDKVLEAYPEPERTRLSEAWADEALAADGADVFALQARRHAWVDRLRRDLSGIARVEVVGDRATIQTVKGTRYPFRKRDNGIWGLTLFTAALGAEAEKAARDAAQIEKNAADYLRVRERERAHPDGG
ncbi:MAG: hypothetical protein HYZ29_02585 [Myxococcales bacterium]|nr:hypothetical protein [Myxococcales bacterium]